MMFILHMLRKTRPEAEFFLAYFTHHDGRLTLSFTLIHLVTRKTRGKFSIVEISSRELGLWIIGIDLDVSRRFIVDNLVFDEILNDVKTKAAHSARIQRLVVGFSVRQKFNSPAEGAVTEVALMRSIRHTVHLNVAL